MVLEATWYLIQEADPNGTVLVDALNGFNKLNFLAILLTLQHRWPAGARFVINSCKLLVQILLCHLGSMPVILLIRYGVTKGDSL